MSAVVLLFVVGLILLAFEVIVPGGVLGMIGVCALIGGCGLAFVEFGLNGGLLASGLAVVLTGVMLWLELKVMPKTALGRRFFLDQSVEGKSQPALAESTAVVGAVVEAVTTLAPSGYVVLDGKRYEAFSRSGLVEAGARLKVVGVDTFRLIVQKSD